ncbi:MAG: TonB-dependent receptor [Gemmatimonadaceae bacterium]
MRFVSNVWRYCIATVIGIVLCSAASPQLARAQGTGIIRGTVTDSSTQQPITGAQVQVVGTELGATTNDQGAYVIRGVSASTVTLRAQRIGFAPMTREITVGAGATASEDFALKPIATSLSQVVVIGYGSSSRRDVSGAVSNVSGSEVTGQPLAGVDAALQGKTPGVQVTQNSGNPGNGITVRIRGSASVSASNQPLYVVDGVPIQQENFSQLGYSGQDVTAITSLDPNEIESITVLKDAASAAIYGSRASNGVILITTKRGQAGKARFTFGASIGQQSVAKKLPLLNAKQYIAYMAEAATNDGYDAADEGFGVGVDDKTSTDWQDAIFRNAPVQNLSLGVSGGSDKIRYYVSGSYFNQKGVVIGSSYQRANGRANLDINATDRLTVSTSIGLSREMNYRVQGDGSLEGIVTNAIGNQPQFPVYNADGTFTDPDIGLNYPNSVALGTYNSSPTSTQRTLANMEARYSLSSALTFTGRAGTDLLNMHERQWQSPLVLGTYSSSVNGIGKSGYSTGDKFTGEGFFTYNGKFHDSSTWTVVAGASTERNWDELNFVRGEQFSSPELHDAGSAASITDYDASRSQHNLVSYFSRANLSVLDRYLLTASIRRDGSSRFGENSRYGLFPAVSAGWIITSEPMFSSLARLGTIKLRGSYGVTGNQGISNFAYLGTYAAANYGTSPGISPNNLSNPDLKWEQTKEADIGFDWTGFGGRIALIADYYNKKTSNLLVNRPITTTSGFSSFFDNVGDVKNTGMEYQLTTQNLVDKGAGNLSWTTDFSFSTNHNEVTALYGNQPIYGGTYSLNTARVGAPLGAFYILKFTGVDPATGDAIYQDTNKDGSVTADDRIVAGNASPTYWGGLTNTFTWKSFDLKGFLQFSGGNKIFNGIRVFADDGGYNLDNKLDYVLSRWQKPGDITSEPRASYDGNSGAREKSTRMLESGSYTRLQEVTLGYKIPNAMLHVGGLQNTRVYVSGHNLLTFTGYRGYSPDVNSNGSDSSIGLGFDFFAYPPARTFTFGISSEW